MKYRIATIIWNFIDRLDRPDFFWKVQTKLMPWAFQNPKNPNSIIFKY